MVYWGIGFIVIGLAIRIVAILSLGKNSTWRIQRPASFVTSGIYKHIRHPLYLSGLIGFFGIGLILTKSWGISLMFQYFMFNYILDRIDREENFLAGCYGQEYLEYFKRTAMLIPKVF